MEKMKSMLFALGVCGFMVAGQALAVTYDFTAGEGYTNGVLTGQQGWVGSSNNTVDVSGSGYAVLSTNEWQSSTAPYVIDASSNNVYTLSVDISWTELSPTNGGNDIVNLLFDGDGSGSPRGYISRVSANGNYALNFKDQEGTGLGFVQFDGAVVGTDNVSDFDTDPLRFSVTMSKGADSNDWSVVVSLSNLTSSAYVESPINGVSSSEAFFNDATLQGSFSSSRTESQNKTTARKIDAFTISASYVAPPAPPAPTIVQWGELGGTSDIVTNSLNYLNVSTTFLAGRECSPTNSTYYTNSVARSPVFNFAADNQFGDRRILEGSPDTLSIGHGKRVRKAMYLWETFLTNNTELSAMAIETKYANSTTNGSYRFVMRQGTNTYFISQAFDMTGNWSDGSDVDASSLTWYSFTPFVSAVETIGTNAVTNTLSDVTAVGCYVEVLGPSYISNLIRYFRATANPAGASTPYGIWATANGVTGDEDDDDDGDGLSNWGEYVFGGDPVPPNGASDQGTQPTFDAASGEYVYSLIGDNTIQYYVLTNLDLTAGPWGTNGPMPMTDNSGTMQTMTNMVGTTESQLFMKLLVE